MKKNILRAAAVCVALMMASAVFAEDLLNANDLTVADLSAEMKVDDTFKIEASAEKAVNIQASDPHTAADGEVFNQRIKLGGAGSAAFRSIVFTAKANAKVTVYGVSSSKTDVRVINVVSSTDGSVVATINVNPDDMKTAGKETVTIPADGSYYLTSKSGGVYIYAVSIQ